MSFVVMKHYDITTALAYDSDFQAEGFDGLGVMASAIPPRW